jgi:hypothetical protein
MSTPLAFNSFASEVTAIVAEGGTAWARLLICILFVPFKLAFLLANNDI